MVTGTRLERIVAGGPPQPPDLPGTVSASPSASGVTDPIPGAAALVARLNHVMALNRHDATCAVPLDLLRETRDALAVAHVLSSDAPRSASAEDAGGKSESVEAHQRALRHAATCCRMAMAKMRAHSSRQRATEAASVCERIANDLPQLRASGAPSSGTGDDGTADLLRDALYYVKSSKRVNHYLGWACQVCNGRGRGPAEIAHAPTCIWKRADDYFAARASREGMAELAPHPPEGERR